MALPFFATLIVIILAAENYMRGPMGDWPSSVKALCDNDDADEMRNLVM